MKSERLKKLKVRISSFSLKDMLNFKNLPLRRDKAIEQAEDKEIVGDFPINNNARALHPDCQQMTVHKIITREDGVTKTLILKKADGTPAAFFRPGQYVSLKIRIGNSYVTRPYSISSSPRLTRDGKVHITVKPKEGGFVSDYLLRKAAVGSSILISGPDGQFFHDDIRDSRNVVAVAGGSGITPFISMAFAIRDGIEDFNLTILFGSRTEDSILFRKELDVIQEETDKVKVIHVLSDEEKPGFEHGFVTADLIRKYAPEDYSLFICGPEGLYRHMEGEVAKLGLPARRVRREILGVTLKAEGADLKTYSLRVIQGPQEYTVPARSDESLLVAIERAGIMAPSRCRSGECGWCRSKLVSGSVFIPPRNDRRRQMDRTSDHIHPCVTFPESDIVLEIPRGDYPAD